MSLESYVTPAVLLGARIDGLGARIDGLERRFDALNARIDRHLEGHP